MSAERVDRVATPPNWFVATLRGIHHRMQRRTQSIVVPDNRIDGRVCLITGASSGLGRAVALELARRGGHLILACRSGIPEVAEDIRARTGNANVEMLHVDLEDLRSVRELSETLCARQRKLDIVVLNAGLMPRRARRTPQGYEVMYSVHFLANRLLLARLFAGGAIVPRQRDAPDEAPRIVFVASDSHRWAPPIDFANLGAFVDYGMRDGMAQYAHTKLLVCTLACELARRYQTDGHVGVGVFALCPGGVASNIARESPRWLKPILQPLLRLVFSSPQAAAGPVVRLACDPALVQRTGVYMHMLQERPFGALALDEQAGRALWDVSARQIDDYV